MHAAMRGVIVLALFAGCTRPSESVHGFEATLTDGFGARTLGEWGQWNAMPGDRLVESTTFLRLRSDADADVRIEFLSDVFVGAPDPSWTVPLRGNVEFATWYVARHVPCGGVAADWRIGDSGRDSVLRLDPGGDACIAYRVLAVPSLLPAQDYRSTYEVVR